MADGSRIPTIGRGDVGIPPVTGAPYREVNSKVATAPKLKVEDKDRVNNWRRIKTVKLNIVKLKASLNKFSRGKLVIEVECQTLKLKCISDLSHWHSPLLRPCASTLSCSGFVRGLPSIRNYPAGSVGPTRVHLTPLIECQFLQCISNTSAGGKTLSIEVIPVANCYDNNRSQYLGGGLTGPVAV